MARRLNSIGRSPPFRDRPLASVHERQEPPSLPAARSVEERSRRESIETRSRRESDASRPSEGSLWLRLSSRVRSKRSSNASGEDIPQLQLPGAPQPPAWRRLISRARSKKSSGSGEGTPPGPVQPSPWRRLSSRVRSIKNSDAGGMEQKHKDKVRTYLDELTGVSRGSRISRLPAAGSLLIPGGTTPARLGS